MLHICSSDVHCHVSKLSPPPHHQPLLCHYRTQSSPKHFAFLSCVNGNVWKRTILSSGMKMTTQAEMHLPVMFTVHGLTLLHMLPTIHFVHSCWSFIQPVQEFQMFQITYNTALCGWMSESAVIY